MIPKSFSFCFNPDCKQPQNFDRTPFCINCGSCLQLANRYEAIQVLGQGEKIRTLLAIDRQTSLCVIKQFWSDATCLYPMRSIYELSGQAFQLLKSSCVQIPKGLEQFEQDNILYLVQEFIPGDNLAHILAQKGTFDTQEVWQILESLLLTISQIHARGVIHGDIKPENIIIRSQETPSFKEVLENLVLVGVGIAIQTEIEILNSPIGSPIYAAPEQLLGRPVFESDLYSLGVTCIHLLTGIHPFNLCDAASGRWVWRDYWLPSAEKEREILAEFLDCLIAPQRNLSAEKALVKLQNLRGKTRPFAQIKESPLNPCQVLQAGKPVQRTGSPNLGDFKSGSLQDWGSRGAKNYLRKKSTPTKQLIGKCDATLLGHHGLFANINAIALNHTQILASASDDKTIRLWNVQTLTECDVLLGHTQQVKTVAFHPQLDNILASGSRDRTIKLWDIQTREAIQTLTSHEQAVNALVFSGDGKLLISGGADKKINLWDFSRGKVIATFRGHTLAVTVLACYQTLLASASADSTVKIWNLATNELICTLTKHTATVKTLAFSPEGNYLATAGGDRTINLWDTKSWQHKTTLSGHPWAISALAFSGETLISASWDTTIKLWQMSTGEEVGVLTGHTDSINCMALDLRANKIVTGSRDRTIKLWSYL